MIGTLVYGALGTLWALDGLRLRGRANALQEAPPSDAPALPGHRFVTRPGVVLPDDVKRAASAFATAHDLQVLDLVPPDLPAGDAFFLLQAIDPAKFRSDRLAKASSAGEAILVHEDVARRMELPKDAAPADMLAFAKLLHRMKQYAPAQTDLAVIPGLSASPREAKVPGLVEHAFGDIARPVLKAQLGIALAGPLLAPLTGTLALLAMHLQSAVATAGTKLHPNDLLRHMLLRTAGDFSRAFAPSAPPPSFEEHRADYDALMAAGTERFFEPRRTDCPHCGGKDLSPWLHARDLLQHKPGAFTLERCGGCEHLFQNPRLTIEGLNFYYRDFYDGIGESGLEDVFASTKEPYLARAGHVAEVANGSAPRRWLDVGTGHAHFCNLARDFFPDTTFEGVDLSASIDEAQRRGWISQAHHGLFPDLAATLAKEPYDVVSMSHYLEHTREPEEEIAAAAKVLRKGGLLMIEIPDPESPFGRVLGQYWLPWFQPQHQHLFSQERLEKLLLRHGFEPVSWHRAEAHQPVDLLFAAGLVVGRIAPTLGRPWHAPPTLRDQAWNKAVWTSAVPALALARLTDYALAPLVKKQGWSNTFRVVARAT